MPRVLFPNQNIVQNTSEFTYDVPVHSLEQLLNFFLQKGEKCFMVMRLKPTCRILSLNVTKVNRAWKIAGCKTESLNQFNVATTPNKQDCTSSAK